MEMFPIGESFCDSKGGCRNCQRLLVPVHGISVRYSGPWMKQEPMMHGYLVVCTKIQLLMVETVDRVWICFLILLVLLTGRGRERG
jgi:hypothetical protein